MDKNSYSKFEFTKAGYFEKPKDYVPVVFADAVATKIVEGTTHPTYTSLEEELNKIYTELAAQGKGDYWKVVDQDGFFIIDANGYIGFGVTPTEILGASTSGGTVSGNFAYFKVGEKYFDVYGTEYSSAPSGKKVIQVVQAL